MLGENICFSLYSGSLLLVKGPNGSGKSTLLRVIQGRSPIFSGSLTVNMLGTQVATLPQMQNPGFHLPITLGDVLTFSLREPLNTDKAFSYGLLEPAHLGLAWNTASGGERKRTLLTRILLQEPSLLLLDEPMNHLDSESRVKVEKAIAQYLTTPSNYPRAAILVSHSNLRTEALLQVPTVHLSLDNAVPEEELASEMSE
jgi:ATPase subunit of ABC transporter with duplicated ATPase domains